MDIEKLNKQFEKSSPEEVLRWALETFGSKVSFASSFGAEDVVVIDMLARLNPKPRVFTLDTGRLNEETYEVMEKIRKNPEQYPAGAAFVTAQIIHNLMSEAGNLKHTYVPYTLAPMHPIETHSALAGMHPIGRMGEVRDIVEAVLYLETAYFVTGEILHVDGGQNAGHA